METILIVCAIVITVAVVAGIVFFIRTMLQVRNTARQAEILMAAVNSEIKSVVGITDAINAFIANLSSPWFKVGGWLTGVVSSLILKRRKEK